MTTFSTRRWCQVILKGDETFFNMPGAAKRGVSLELEDAITVSSNP